MNSLQESHLKSILDRVVKDIDIKYRAGQKEHGGCLWDRDVIGDAIHEAIDMITYIYTIDYKRRQCISLIENAICQLHGHEELESTKLLLIMSIELLTENKNPKKE